MITYALSHALKTSFLLVKESLKIRNLTASTLFNSLSFPIPIPIHKHEQRSI